MEDLLFAPSTRLYRVVVVRTLVVVGRYSGRPIIASYYCSLYGFYFINVTI
jgi:hypothetical protein